MAANNYSFPCILCYHVTYDTLKELADHQRGSHSDEPGILWCSLCKLGFPDKHRFKAHGPRCQGPQTVAVTKYEEIDDQQNIEGSSCEDKETDHVCHVCGKKIRGNAVTFTTHVREHAPTVKLPYVCPKKHCGRPFATKEELRNHRKNCFP